MDGSAVGGYGSEVLVVKAFVVGSNLDIDDGDDEVGAKVGLFEEAGVAGGFEAEELRGASGVEVRIMSKLKLNRGFALLSLDRMVDGREKERQEAGEVRVGEIIRKYYEKLSRVFLVISTIIASLSFTAAINPPGGYKGKGIAFLRENDNFKKFMLFDLLAFGFSSSSIIIHCLAAYLSATRTTYPRQLAYLLTFVSILSMTLAFWSGIIAVYGAKTRSNSDTTTIT
ncbi:hypothetical protein CMV_016107 [Castanea mollissima]|uniref:PGG domain-containing protein n=1 Tax=Castanea mollissima TaxID=60419 RepID=A0A8J4QUJ4_9ROSI|nr:hypothetical protein CMV_016107 [Castanea mollissima]